MIKIRTIVADGEQYDIYDYECMLESEVIGLIETLDFEVIKTKSEEDIIYKLIDITGANLGNIEDEEFYTVEQMVDRLENYWLDHHISFEGWYCTEELDRKNNREVKVIKMTMEKYMEQYGEQYNEGELFDYPLEELDYIVEDTDISTVALIGDRLYEID